MRDFAAMALVLVCAGCGASSQRDDDQEPLYDDGERANQLAEHGITWSFDEPVRYGRFANGHYWVIGPLTVTDIAPRFSGGRHGWEVNPSDPVAQGFDARIADYDDSRVPALPYEALPGESLVKSLSLEPLDDTECRPCTQSASVLTVLDEVPPDEGRTVLRPPYFGEEKPLYSTADLRVELLPQHQPTESTPSFADVAADYAIVQLDHKLGWTGRPLHPSDAMPDYGATIASRNAGAAVALMTTGTPEAKAEALARYLNDGIDIYHMMLGGVTWPPGGGHGEGRKLPAVVAAVLLDDTEMMDALASSGRDVFGENGGMYFSEAADVVLFGQTPNTEEAYWTNLVFDTGSRTIIDPYEMIDGGHRPGGSYQFCCTAKNWKATATALRLMPELVPVFNHEAFLTYVDRWVDHGAWTQPDPCAPPDGICAGGEGAGEPCTTANEPEVCTGEDAFCDTTVNWDTHYGVTYGPDGEGGCIADTDASDGTGRFPLLHGTSTNDGHHSSQFADEMWEAHVAP